MTTEQRVATRRKLRLSGIGKASVVGVFVVLQSGVSAIAQTVSPTTTIDQLNAQRLQELAEMPRQSGPVVISPDAAAGQIVEAGGPTVFLADVLFSPTSAFLSEEDLDGIVADYVANRVDFSQIQRLVQDVNDLYTRKGVVTASAVLPPQTLSDGILKVRLVEGTLSTFAISGNNKIPDSFVLDRVRLTTGNNIVDVPTATEDITRFNQLYNSQLRVSLQPGALFGTTDLALELAEPKTNQLSFFIDNQGVQSTGQIQFGTFFQSYSLLTPDDNLLAFGTRSNGSLSGTLSYDAPVTPEGTRLGLTYSRSAIEVIDGPTKSLNVVGSSASFGASLTVPVYISPTWSLFGVGGFSYGISDSFSNATPLVDSATTRYSVALTGSYSDKNVAFTIRPQVALANAEDFIATANRDTTLFTGSLNGTSQLENGIVLTVNGAWQYTDTKLLPGDLLFQIGGPSTVRGFPSNGSSGDSGYFVQFEAHKITDIDGWANGSDLFGFVDIGSVYSTFPERVSFASAGAAIKYSVDEKASLEIGVGFPLNTVVANQSDFEIYTRITVANF